MSSEQLLVICGVEVSSNRDATELHLILVKGHKSGRRPGLVRRAHASPPAPPLDGGLSGGACDAASLAPQARREEVRHEPGAPAGPGVNLSHGK
jgi:hypothetical protein